MRDNLGGEIDPAEGSAGAARRIFLTFYPAQVRGGCDRGSEIVTVYSGKDGEGPVHPRKLVEEGICEKDFISKSSGCAYSLQ